MLAKGDPKFAFLRPGHSLYTYYAWQRRHQQQALAKLRDEEQAAKAASAAPLTSSKTSTRLGTVSFKLFKKSTAGSAAGGVGMLQPGVQFSDDDEEEGEEEEEQEEEEEEEEEGRDGHDSYHHSHVDNTDTGNRPQMDPSALGRE